ncbi:MAG: peptidyl-prolyl cis-trans isomerase [Chlamydiota bacterium]
MINRYFIHTLCVAILCSTPLFSRQNAPFLFSSTAPKKVEVNNRILAVVDGKPISVYDLMKKLDVIFYKQFPQYADSDETKYQFYQYNWKVTLRDLIDKELILSDAEEVKLPLTTGDIRQEMETLFGPNIISNLDRLGMSYEEAYEIVKGDLTIKRMMGARVSNKAQKRITPQALLKAYEEFAVENIRPTEWDYRILSVRHKDATRAAEIANAAYRLLTEKHVPLDEMEEKLNNIGLIDKNTKYNLSKPLHHNDKEVSESYRIALAGLRNNTFSEPQVHKVRSSNEKIVRIFHVEKFIEGGPVPFAEVETKLTNQIRNHAMDEETDAYLKHLREHFHVDEEEIIASLPDDFQPFTLH